MLNPLLMALLSRAEISFLVVSLTPVISSPAC
nr:MAG TPA: hypothetical protein [Caudoviricetes sp.]